MTTPFPSMNAKHDDAVSIHECHPGKSLAIFESVTHQRLLRLEAALGHLIGLQGVRVLHFLAARLLAHLPLQLGDPACRTSATHETNGGISDFDFIRDVQPSIFLP